MKNKCSIGFIITLLILLIVTTLGWAQTQAEVAKPLFIGSKWVPSIGISYQSLALDKLEENAMPKTFGELTGGTNQELQVLTLEEAMRFGIPTIFTNVDSKYTRRILIKNFIAYKLITRNNQTIKVGAGIRWIMDVATMNANTELSFPVIAAQAQLGMATAKIKIVTQGINNDAINAALNVPTELNVENYFKMTGGFEKAKSLINSDMVISPEEVEKEESTSKPDDDYTKALLVSWALSSIAREQTLQKAQDSCPIKNNLAKSLIADIYKDFTNILASNLTERPNPEQREKAKRLLNGITVYK